MPYVNNKGADQPAQPHSLISIFIIQCLDSMICILAISNDSIFWLASVDEQAGLIVKWSKIPEYTFLHDVAQLLSWVTAVRGKYLENEKLSKSSDFA